LVSLSYTAASQCAVDVIIKDFVSHVKRKNENDGNMTPGRVFGPTRDEVTADWRKVENEKLHNFFSLLNIMMIKSRRNGIGEACSMHAEDDRCMQNSGLKA
jgi:hypothetical protein